MNHQQEALYSIALRKSAGVGDITFQKLIEEFVSAESVCLDAPKILKNINKFNLKSVMNIIWILQKKN